MEKISTKTKKNILKMEKKLLWNVKLIFFVKNA